MKINNYGAIDLGSNALRLLISTVAESPIEVTFNKTVLIRTPIRLGTDAFVKKKISLENIKRVVCVMQAYALLMQVHNVKDYLAYATSAVRDAQNGPDLIKRVWEFCGIHIEIIDGDKEASILFNVILNQKINKKDFCLFIDVGGGSTELTIFRKREILTSHSFPIGTVRLLNQLVKEDFIYSNIAPWLKKQSLVLKDAVAMGSGGNISCLLKLLGKAKHTSVKIDEIKKWISTLDSITYEERIFKYHLNPDRVDVIVPALNIYYSIMNCAEIKNIYIPKIGLSDGMIQEIYRRSREY